MFIGDIELKEKPNFGGKMQDFRSLEVWEKAHDLTMKIYKVSRSFPSSELYGITSQIRRAVVSIATNISEGSSRGSDADFARFVQIAVGSLSEVEYLLFLCKELDILANPDYETLNDDVIYLKKKLINLLKKLRYQP